MGGKVPLHPRHKMCRALSETRSSYVFCFSRAICRILSVQKSRKARDECREGQKPCMPALTCREQEAIISHSLLLKYGKEMWPRGRRHSPAKGAYGQNLYRGFESLHLRQEPVLQRPKMSKNPCKTKWLRGFFVLWRLKSSIDIQQTRGHDWVKMPPWQKQMPPKWRMRRWGRSLGR